MMRIEKNAVVVTLVSNDGDLADLLKYLSKYDELTQCGLLRRAQEWLTITCIGGVSGADSARMDFGLDAISQPHSGHPSKPPE